MRRFPTGGYRYAGAFSAKRVTSVMTCVVVIALGSWLQPAAAAALDRPDPEVRTVEPGSSGRSARQEALEALSRVRMPKDNAKLVRECVRSTTLYRRLPTQEFDCHPELLAFALEHPEGIVDIWRVLEISHLTLDPAGPDQWRMADGYGTVGTMRMLSRSGTAERGVLVMHGRGGYAGPFAPKPLTGNCIVLLRYDYDDARGSSGNRVCLKTDAFLDVDGLGLELVTRTLHPLIVATAGWNVHEICLFMGHLSRTASENPQGVERLSARLTGIAPDQRQQLAVAARRAGGTHNGTTIEPDIARRLASRWMSNAEPEASRPLR